MIKLISLVLVLLLNFAAIGFAQSAGASPIYEVKFVKGRFVTNGSVSAPPVCTPNSPTECGESGMTFSFRGRPGDRVRITLTSASTDERARFAVETPRRNPLQNGYSGDSWSGTLRSSGDYLIEIWIQKGSTPFTLTVTRN